MGRQVYLNIVFNEVQNETEIDISQRMPYSYWIEIRTHYVILSNLVELVDRHISILVVVSFASNLYFICLQLFNSFSK